MASATSLAFHSTATMASTTATLAFRSASASTISQAQTLEARMFIPTIGNVPSTDPVVYVSIAGMLFFIVLAIFLLVWTQRRSAAEVWETVGKRGRYTHLKNSTRFGEGETFESAGEMEAGQVRICHNIPYADSEAGSDAGSDCGHDGFEECDIAALASVPTPSRVKTLRFISFSDTHLPLMSGALEPTSNADRHSAPAETFEQILTDSNASQTLPACDALEPTHVSHTTIPTIVIDRSSDSDSDSDDGDLSSDDGDTLALLSNTPTVCANPSRMRSLKFVRFSDMMPSHLTSPSSSSNDSSEGAYYQSYGSSKSPYQSLPSAEDHNDGFSDVFEHFYSSQATESEAFDLGVSSKRRTKAEQQFHELHFNSRY